MDAWVDNLLFLHIFEHSELHNSIHVIFWKSSYKYLGATKRKHPFQRTQSCFCSSHFLIKIWASISWDTSKTALEPWMFLIIVWIKLLNCTSDNLWRPMSPCGIHYITFRDHRRVWATEGFSHGNICFGKSWYVTFCSLSITFEGNSCPTAQCLWCSALV